jgi:uncharacterized membrane protein YesL
LAGFFGLFDFTKPGKGVDVEAPPKKAFFRFWELYWRKFTRFIVLNMIAFAFLLPIVTFLYILYMNWYHEFLVNTGVLAELVAEAENAEGGVFFFGMLPSMLVGLVAALPPAVSLLLLVVSIVLYGPVMCGMTYVLRNFSREEHAWISDFFVRLKSNFRQGTVLGMLEILAFTTLLFNIITPASGSDGGLINASMPVIRYVSVFLLILILFARQYIYAMAVTFNLKLRGIIKNAFAFAFLGLFRNFAVVAAELAILAAIIIIPYADIILLPFFFFSFTGFLTIFATFPLIHRHMILPVQQREAEGETGDTNDTDSTDEKAGA